MLTAITLDFDKQDGLVPVIVMYHETKQVLMLAYMNEEAFQLTKETKQMHYWIRSGKEAKDRKANLKEGSYTNYLYNKGLDKILKKIGEEATEVVIAAKNADKDEIANETADVLYHLVVMLVETGENPEDVEVVLQTHQGK